MKFGHYFDLTRTMDDQKVSSVPIHTFSVNSEMSKCLECSAAEKRYVNCFLLILLLFSETVVPRALIKISLCSVSCS